MVLDTGKKMNPIKLKEYVEANPTLVKLKPTSKENVFVLKYSNKVFFNNLFNEYLEECRGTVVDKDYNVISRPFSKIYNYGIESQSPVLDLDTQVVAYRKVNGFMVALTWYDNDILVSTTGTIDSDFVQYAREMMLLEQPWEDWVKVIKMNKEYTFMFECVHPSDPHIIPEDFGMYFIGARKNTWDSVVNGYDGGIESGTYWKDFGLHVFNCKYAESEITTLAELLVKAKNCKHEGYVFYTKDGVSAKIKSPYYLFKKFLVRCKNTNKLIREDIKNNLDEEFYPIIDAIQADINTFTSMEEQDRLTWIRKFLEK